MPSDLLTGILHTILFTVDVRGPFLDPRIPGYIDLVHNHADRELATAMSESLNNASTNNRSSRVRYFIARPIYSPPTGDHVK